MERRSEAAYGDGERPKCRQQEERRSLESFGEYRLTRDLNVAFMKTRREGAVLGRVIH